ncbi:MAG TPA: hypothetical protein VH475_13050 [Tepidisphaeraceae bacterium]|jgi:hypothetical protein
MKPNAVDTLIAEEPMTHRRYTQWVGFHGIDAHDIGLALNRWLLNHPDWHVHRMQAFSAMSGDGGFWQCEALCEMRSEPKWPE